MTSILQTCAVVVPLLATAAGFLMSLGRAAYYRILTEYDAPNIQAFVSQFLVGALLLTLLMAMSMSGLVPALFPFAVVVVLDLAFGAVTLYETFDEVDGIEGFMSIIILACLAFALWFATDSLASVGRPIEFEVDISGSLLEINVFGTVVFFLLVCVLFFEMGFVSSKWRKTYLVNWDERQVVLSVVSGGRAVCRNIVETYGDDCVLGSEISFVCLEGGGKFIWCRFGRIIIGCRGNARPSDFCMGRNPRVFHYSEAKRLIKRTGVGQAESLQRNALMKSKKRPILECGGSATSFT